VIVLVAGDHIEDHATKLLVAGLHGKPQALDDIEGLLVGVSAGGVEIEVSERSERLHMQFAAITQAIEPPRHEMPPAALFQQIAFGHLDAGIRGHEGVRILDHRISFGVIEFLVLVGADPVELEQPVVEAGRGFHLARAHFIRVAIPRDDGLRPRTACGGAHTQHLLEPIVPPTRSK